MGEQIKYQSRGAYQDLYDESIRNPKGFWARQADLIHWHKPFDKVLDDSKPPFAAWYVGGQTNLCYNAVDRHLDQLGDKPALIYVSTEVDQEKTYTFRQLHQEVQIAAAMLQKMGVKKGDRVLIYMPMIPEPHLPCWPVPELVLFILWCLAGLLRTVWHRELMTPNPK